MIYGCGICITGARAIHLLVVLIHRLKSCSQNGLHSDFLSSNRECLAQRTSARQSNNPRLDHSGGDVRPVTLGQGESFRMFRQVYNSPGGEGCRGGAQAPRSADVALAPPSPCAIPRNGGRGCIPSASLFETALSANSPIPAPDGRRRGRSPCAADLDVAPPARPSRPTAGAARVANPRQGPSVT